MDYFDRFSGVKHKKSYDEATSLSLAVACDLAYKSKTMVSTTVEDWGYTFHGFINVVKKPDIDTQCFVMSDEKNIVVVFRGSESLQDWFANFQTVYDPGPLKNTKAHEGFQDSLFPAVIGITNFIDQASPSGKKIWITGHSLGGALSSLFAGMLLENEYSVYGLYTFASPRPGDGAFEKLLNKKVTGPHYRVVNFGDVVPHVPPEPFYSHPGKRIILKARTKQRTKTSWWKERINALKLFIKNTAQILDVGDNHRLSADDESYIPRLIKDLERNQ